MINWIVSPTDEKLLEAIAERAVRMAQNADISYPYIDAVMDISAAHLNGNPLRLKELLVADDFNFAHDVFGVRRHLDRITGKLKDNFVPRFSKPSRTEVSQ